MKYAVGAGLLVLSVLPLTACGGGPAPVRLATSYGEGLTRPVGHASPGGTLRLALTDAPVSLDPGNLGYAYATDLSRLYARPLVTYAPGPGPVRLVPDLAEDLGRPSDGGRTWTYKLKQGVKYEDGTPVRARDVKYAVARSNYTTELADGPKNLRDVLKGAYWGPYLDKDPAHFTAIATPDDHTVVFHLKRPFADFDFLAASPQTAPVPSAKDTRKDYQRHPLSTGPYRFAEHDVGNGFTLVRNQHAARGLPDRIKVTERVAAADLDQRLLTGGLDADLSGAGLLPHDATTVLADPAHKARADNAATGVLRYAALSTKVAPFNDPHCRLAVRYAADRAAVQRAYGTGTVADGVLPPNVTGHEATPFARDLKRARQELRSCGHPGGFHTAIAARPADAAAARALRDSLAAVGIVAKVTDVSPFTWGNIAGKPAYVHTHDLGILLDAQAGDWPSGYAFLRPITGPATKQNNHDLMELSDPALTDLLDKGQRTSNATARANAWATAARRLTNTGAYLPLIDDTALLYRPPTLTGAYVNPAYGMYDYAALGVRVTGHRSP